MIENGNSKMPKTNIINNRKQGLKDLETLNSYIKSIAKKTKLI